MKTSPKDFFLHLGVIAALYIGAVSFVNLIFNIIDAAFPRIANYEYFGTSSISWPVATLIIVFPIFVLLSWLLGREYKINPEKKMLGVRKWLVYITLFVAGIAIAVDLIVLLYTFLNGEIITAGFILKVLGVLIVAGAIFSYYISDLRNTTSPKRNKIYAWVIGAVIVLLIIAGFSITGSPRTQRMLRVDSQKVADLQNIQWQIVNYWQQKETLPASIGDLNDPISGFIVPTDPDDGASYEYRVVSNASPARFELCANFGLPSRNGNSMAYTKPVGIGMENENWNHGSGRTCFERVIDPQLYPLRSKTNNL